MKDLKHIMLIDDDTNANFYNKYILQELNKAVNIIEMTRGQDGLDYLLHCKEKIDIVLLDINMPLMDGWEFLKVYDRFPKTKKAQTIFFMLTSSINPEDRKRVLDYPYVKQFFNKPLDFETLERMLDIYRKTKDSENLSESEIISYDEENHMVIASYTGILDKSKKLKFISDVAQFSKKHQCHYILFNMVDVIESYGFYDLYEIYKNLMSLTGLTIRDHCAFLCRPEGETAKSRLEFKTSVAKNWGQDIFKNFTDKEEALQWLKEKRAANKGRSSFLF